MTKDTKESMKVEKQKLETELNTLIAFMVGIISKELTDIIISKYNLTEK